MEIKNKGTKTTVESIENCVTPYSMEIKSWLTLSLGHECNDVVSGSSQKCLEEVMKVLTDPHTHLIGVYGAHNHFKDTPLEIVYRRVHRDKLFDMVLTTTVTKTPDVKKIQKEIAGQLGLIFNHKSKDKRAQELIKRIKNEQKIMIVLCDLHKGLDLGKIGIPYGADHTGCKILLTSTSKDVLSNHMHTRININAGF